MKSLFADFAKAFVVSREIPLHDVNHVVIGHVGKCLQPKGLLLVSAVANGSRQICEALALKHDVIGFAVGRGKNDVADGKRFGS